MVLLDPRGNLARRETEAYPATRVHQDPGEMR